jgi:hypothetical protein
MLLSVMFMSAVSVAALVFSFTFCIYTFSAEIAKQQFLCCVISSLDI